MGFKVAHKMKAILENSFSSKMHFRIGTGVNILQTKGKLFPDIMRDSRHFNCELFPKIIRNSRHKKF